MTQTAMQDREPAARDVAPVELDHFFVWVTSGAPERAGLEAIGLRPFPELIPHPGQGTSAIAFLFENAYLEMLWLDDEEAAARAGREAGADFLARGRFPETGASRFGVGLRRADDTDPRPAPFPTADYVAEWMPPGCALAMDTGVRDLAAPMVFVEPGILTFEAYQERMPQLLDAMVHPAGVRRLTRARLTVPAALAESPAMRALAGAGAVAVSVAAGAEELLELELDGGTAHAHDLRPALPVVIRW